MLFNWCKSIATGVNAMDLRSGINMAVEAVVSDLKSKAVMISTPEEITQVATISANGERSIGELIARAMEKVGKEGVITVSDGKTLDNELEVVEGMKLDRGYISPYFITDQKTRKCELDNPLVLIHEKKVSDVGSLVQVLELALQMNRPLLIVAEDIEGDALTLLILNSYRAGLKVCAIKAPGFGESRKANLDDLAVFTGGEVISGELGLTLDKIKESTSTFDKEKAQERLSKLSGGVAVFKVGGSSEAEVSERKDRVIDALNATRAAVEEGIVPEVIFGEDNVTTGASNDFMQVSRVARQMVERFGFSKKIGQIAVGGSGGNPFLGQQMSSQKDYSMATADVVDGEVRELVEVAYRRAKEIITTHIDILHKLANLLIEKETVDGEEFMSLFIDGQAELYVS